MATRRRTLMEGPGMIRPAPFHQPQTRLYAIQRQFFAFHEYPANTPHIKTFLGLARVQN